MISLFFRIARQSLCYGDKDICDMQCILSNNYYFDATEANFHSGLTHEI